MHNFLLGNAETYRNDCGRLADWPTRWVSRAENWRHGEVDAIARQEAQTFS